MSWLQIPPGAHWLDVGCGTGSLALAIRGQADPASVVGCDPAHPFVAFARERTRDARITFVVTGIGGLPRRPEGYDSVTSLLALNFFPDPEAAVREMRSITAPLGTVSACVWDYSDGMQFLRRFWDAALEADPSARDIDEGHRFPLCDSDALADLFRRGDLADVRCEPLEVRTTFADFDDYWRPLLGGTGPAPSYLASLDADRLAILARRLEETLPREKDGTIDLTARAWAVRGIAK